MKRLLLITSEPLHPGSLLTSTFELTQATILQERFDVAILSVTPPRTARSAAGKFSPAGFGRLASFSADLLKGRRRVNAYRILGIPVYEGKNDKWYSKADWLGELTDWVRAGYAAYRYYVQVSGVPDIVHAHGRFINAGALAVEIKKKDRVPFVYTEHSTAYQSGTAPDAARKVLDRILGDSDRVVTVSTALRRQMEKFLHHPIAGTLVQPNVVDPLFEAPLPLTAGRPGTGFCFLCIASFHPKKGLTQLIDAFRLAFPEDSGVRLTICGDGPMRNEIEMRCVKNHLQGRVCFPGEVSREQIRQYLDQSDALVLSSLQETFGVAVIEALARGLPVVATRSGGPEEIVTAEDGLLVAPGDVPALAAAMKQLASGYEKYDRSLIRAAALRRFGGQAFRKSSEGLYASVLGEPAIAPLLSIP